MADQITTYKGFIKDLQGNKILPITRAELVLDSLGKVALFSEQFLAKDGHPGLITAAEREILSGGGNGISVGDLNTKLNYINEGFKVGETALKFYDYKNTILTHTPITLNTDDSLQVTLANNVITFALKDISAENALTKTTKYFIDSISVDKYGRVTSVTHKELTNDDLPDTISNKTLNGCTTTVPENAGDTALVNKKYVDSKFSVVSAGALQFGGTITDTNHEDDYSDILNSSHVNYYYKVTTSFTLNKEYLYSETNNIKVKSGDTLIVYKDGESYKFVYIPSGDEITTQITAIQGGTNSQTYSPLLGNVNIQFDEPLSVTADKDRNVLQVSLPEASSSTSGYLSAADYVKFSQYAAKTMTITPSLTAGYEIGKITLDGKDTILYGKDYSLILEADETTLIDPSLKFNSTPFTFKSSSTIGVKKIKDSNAIQFTGLYQSGNTNLLNIEGNTITVVPGSADNTTGVVIYEDFSNLSKVVSQHLAIGLTSETITTSLKTNEGNTDEVYYYGSNKLISAITITV